MQDILRKPGRALLMGLMLSTATASFAGAADPWASLDRAIGVQSDAGPGRGLGSAAAPLVVRDGDRLAAADEAENNRPGLRVVVDGQGEQPVQVPVPGNGGPNAGNNGNGTPGATVVAPGQPPRPEGQPDGAVPMPEGGERPVVYWNDGYQGPAMLPLDAYDDPMSFEARLAAARAELDDSDRFPPQKFYGHTYPAPVVYDTYWDGGWDHWYYTPGRGYYKDYGDARWRYHGRPDYGYRGYYGRGYGYQHPGYGYGYQKPGYGYTNPGHGYGKPGHGYQNPGYGNAPVYGKPAPTYPQPAPGHGGNYGPGAGSGGYNGGAAPLSKGQVNPFAGSYGGGNVRPYKW